MKKPIKIKVFGVGGAGGNAISRMMASKIEGVELVAVNTDIQDLKKTKAHKKIKIGEKEAKGLGTGMSPKIGEKAALESFEELKQEIIDTDLIFITCGLGGGTGTGAAPVLAGIANDLGILTIAVVTLPFTFEGAYRANIARQGLEKLEKKVDSLMIIPNDKILSINKEISVSSAFWHCDEVLRQSVSGISDLIMLPGIINIDFATVKAILKSSGPSIFGLGIGKGEKRAQEAITRALKSPLLKTPSKKAKGVLFNVSGMNVSLSEINEIAEVIKERTTSDAKIIFGAIQDEKLKNGELKVTLFATGFN